MNQRPFRSQIGFLSFLMAAIFALSAVAHAADGVATKDKIDPDQTITDGCDKVLDIHGAIVRIRFVRQTIFFAVKSGELECKDLAGNFLFTAPAGSVVMLGPVDGTPKIGGLSAGITLNTFLFSTQTLLDRNRQNIIANQLMRLTTVISRGTFFDSRASRLALQQNAIDVSNNLRFSVRVGPYGTVTWLP